MATAKCFQCGATAQADTFEQARGMLDHAIGLARGIKCGNAYGAVEEIKPVIAQKIITTPAPINEEQKVTETEKEEPKIEKITSKKSKIKKY